MSCLIEEDTYKVIMSGKELHKAIRKLRRDLVHCQTCASREDCQFLASFHAMINVAIDEVNEEWRGQIEGES